MKDYFKLALPHIVAITVFVLFSSMFFSPLFQGYSLKQSDVKQYQGMSKEILDHYVVNEEDPLWTNSMFGGMPAYQILVYEKNNMLSYVDRAIKLGLPKSAAILFTVMLGFYIFALCLSVNPWLGMGAAVAYGFCTINILYIGAGHITKVNTIAYIAPTLGGLILAFRGKIFIGAAVFSLFFGLNLMANHPQMTYYLGFACLFIGLGEFYRCVKSKKAREFLYASGLLIFGAVLALVSNASSLLPTQEYSAYTTRGATELTIEPDGSKKEVSKQSGLDTDYILEYNYGGGELLSMIIPKARGEKGAPFGNDEALVDYMSERDTDMETSFSSDKTFLGQSTYWGGQRFSGGAFYFGVVLFVLFLFGMVFLKDGIKWPVLALVILTMLLASNDPGGINAFFIHKFPLYNKFRDSKMILILVQLMIPMIALLFIDGLTKSHFSFSNAKKVYVTSGVIFLFFAILMLIPSLSGSFISDNESKLFADAVQNQPDAKDYFNGLKSAMKDARIFLFKQDALRALGLAFITLICILFYHRKKSFSLSLFIVIGVFAIGDNFSVSKRYLNTNESMEDRDADRISNLTNAGFMNENEDRIAYESFEPTGLSLLPAQMPGQADQFILDSEKSNIDNFDKQVLNFKNSLNNHFYYDAIKNENLRDLIASFAVLNENTNYRVLTLGNPFNETRTSYYHKSIGGYHGAKLKSYQELIDFRIGREMAYLQQNINIQGMAVFNQTPTLNMLNTKYVILNTSQRPLENTFRFGNAWFVSNIQKVRSADDEILALSDSTLDFRETAVVRNEFSGVETVKDRDQEATIEMIKYAANEIEYRSKSTSNQLAIFSEIYYPKGWNCYIDGKLTPSFRANYILRGVKLLKGEHKIIWKFEPSTFFKAKTASMFGSLTLISLCLVVFGLKLRPFLSKSDDSLI